MESIEMLNKVDEIKNSLKRIETTLTGNNKTTNETRIGALNRISEAVESINFLLQSRSVITKEYHFNKLEEIRNILLGIN